MAETDRATTDGLQVVGDVDNSAENRATTDGLQVVGDVDNSAENRATTDGLQVVGDVDNSAENRVTTDGLQLVYLAEVAPDKPTISIPDPDAFQAEMFGDAYSHSEGAAHSKTHWQVDDTSSAMGSLIFDFEDEHASPPLPYPSTIKGDLSAGTQYWGRVRYQSETGVWSEWSDVVSFTTDSATLPTKPSITSAIVDDVSVVLHSSDWVDGASRTHVATQWQIDVSAGDFSTPEADVTDTVSTDLTVSERIPGFIASTSYKARVRQQANDATWSEWSDAYSFSTLAAPSDRPAKPTVTVDSYDHNSAVFSTSAYSHPSSTPHHSTQWWVTEEDPGGFDLTEAYRNREGSDVKELWDTSLESWDLAQNQKYNVAARHRDFDGDWSEWSTFVSFTTDNVVDGLGTSEMVLLRPRHGLVVQGDTVYFELNATGFTADSYDLELSVDYGVTFAAIATGVSLPYELDVSGLTDGAQHVVRIRPQVGSDFGAWHYRMFYLDRAGDQFIEYYDADEADPDTLLDDFTQSGADPANQAWGVSGTYLCNYQPAGASWPRNSYRFAGLDAALEPDQFDVHVEGFSSGRPGYLPSHWLPEFNRVGVAGYWIADPMGGEDPYQAIYAVLTWDPQFCAIPDCSSVGIGDMSLTLYAFADGLYQGILGTYAWDRGAHFTYLLGSGCGGGAPYWQWQCIRCDWECIRRNVLYGIRLRCTVIRELGNGNRDIRVQAAVYGPNVLTPDVSPWVIDTVWQNTSAECGAVGPIAGDFNEWGQIGYRFVSHFTSFPISFGPCDAPPDFEEPPALEDCPPPAFDLTLIGDDDITPILGSVDANGDVVDASFSTLATHNRPYLKVYASGPEHEVDPIGGGSSVGGMSAEVLDKRLTACDPKTGILTAELGDLDGYNALIGRRAIVRERGFDDSWHVILDGIVYGVRLLNTLVTLQLDLRDARERERNVRIFTKNETCGIVPDGPVNGYGCLGPIWGGLEFCFMQPIETFEATWRFIWTATGEPTYGFAESSYHGKYSWETLEMGQPKPVVEDTETEYRYTDVTVRWRLPGEDETAWRYVRDMPTDPNYGDGTYNFFRDTWAAAAVALTLLNPRKGFVEVPTVFFMNIEDGDEVPGDGVTIECQVLAHRTTERYPFYYEGSAGTFLQNIYDGEYSDVDPNIRYDADAMADFVDQGPQLRLVKHEPDEDLRNWVEKNIYGPTSWVAGLTGDGKIAPVDTSLPDNTESLTTLDSAVVISGAWEQDGGKAVPISTYRIKRDYMVQEVDTPRIWTLESLDVEFVQLARSSALLTTKGVTFEPETIRSLGGSDGASLSDELMDEAPVRLAVDRNLEVTTRYAYGPEWIGLRVRDTAEVRALTVGSWFVLDLDYIPNLATGTRGGDILCLVLRRQKDPGLAWQLHCLAAGPGSVGLTAPTLGEITVS